MHSAFVCGCACTYMCACVRAWVREYVGWKMNQIDKHVDTCWIIFTILTTVPSSSLQISLPPSSFFRVCWGRWKMMMTIMMRTCNRWRVLVLTQTIFSLLFCRKTNSGSGLKTCHVILDPAKSSEILPPDVSPCACNCIFASLRCQGAHVHVLVCAFYSQICWNLLWKKMNGPTYK